MKVKATRGKIFIHEPTQKNKRTKSGIIVPVDDTRGRWVKVASVGPDIDFVKEGEWILIPTAGKANEVRIDDYNSLYIVDPAHVLSVEKEKPASGQKVKPRPDKIIIYNIQRGERQLASGIVLTNDDGKEHGIRARWAQIYAIGDDIDYVKEGQWVLLQHGRWSRGIEHTDGNTIYSADAEALLAVSDEKPNDMTVGNTSESGFKKFRF